MRSFLKQAWPWLVGLAITIVILTRVPFDAFRESIHHGPHVRLAVVDFLVIVALLVTDSLATWVALLTERVRWTFGRTFAVRGATYLLSLLNYAVGQGGIVYYLHRAGMSGRRATGVMLFTMGTTFAVLLLVTTASWGFAEQSHAAMWWMLVAGCGAFVVYLVIIAMRPAVLENRELLAPLFEPGLRGYAFAIVARLPHVVIIVLGHWFAFIAWGIPVPFGVAATLMPAVVIAAVLPISPGGLGTTQGALILFFSDYAAGATADDRAASVLAFSIVHFVYATLAQLVIGLACIPLARRGDPPPVAQDA